MSVSIGTMVIIRDIQTGKVEAGIVRKVDDRVSVQTADGMLWSCHPSNVYVQLAKVA